MKFELPKPEEKKSGINKVIGGHEGSQQGSLDYFEHRKKRMAEASRDRKGHEVFDRYEEVITTLNQQLVDFLVEQGLQKPQEMKFENFIFTHSDDFPVEGAGAVYAINSGSIFFKMPEKYEDFTDGRLIGFSSHEFIHAHSFQSANVHSWPEMLPSVRRVGVALRNREGEETGNWLNEAITEELNVRFLSSRTEDSLPAGYDTIVSGAKEYLAKDGIGIYIHERSFLKMYIDLLYQYSNAKYESPEAIYRLFFEGYLNGNILPVARKVEGVVGKGGFRTFMEMPREQIKQIIEEYVATLDFSEESNTQSV